MQVEKPSSRKKRVDVQQAMNAIIIQGTSQAD
jgi:hypothetical protein